MLIAIAVALLAVIIGAMTEWRYVLAPLLGLLIIRWAFATFRSMVHGSGVVDAPPQPVSPSDPERTLYWCGECGAELLLTVRGSGKAPRHCGTGMHERTEITRT